MGKPPVVAHGLGGRTCVCAGPITRRPAGIRGVWGIHWTLTVRQALSGHPLAGFRPRRSCSQSSPAEDSGGRNERPLRLSPAGHLEDFSRAHSRSPMGRGSGNLQVHLIPVSLSHRRVNRAVREAGGTCPHEYFPMGWGVGGGGLVIFFGGLGEFGGGNKGSFAPGPGPLGKGGVH